MLDPLIVVILGVIVVALTSAIAPRLGIAGPLMLVAIGAIVSLLPFIPEVKLDPEIILVGVLPPLLYSAAVSLPAIEFRRDFRPIAGLSVLLVLVSAVVLGGFFYLVIPTLGLPLAIGLGAILSPTDAVATSIAKRVGLSGRVITMLEGESLLNDATSLVLLRTAVAAFVAGSVSWGEAIGSFVWGIVIAIVIGAVIGALNLRVRLWVSHSAANTALSFAVPFVAYLPTEALGGSGLVAAVVAGIVTGQGAARFFTPEQRMSDELNWRTVELVLEGSVFLLMGLELEDIVTQNQRDHQGIGHALWLAAAALGIILLVRAAYVSVLIRLQSRRARDKERENLEAFKERITRADAMPGAPSSAPRPPRPAPPTRELSERERARMVRRRRRMMTGGRRRLLREPERRERWLARMRTRITRSLADIDYYQASPLGWRHGTIIVWGGMRGVVTLAAAQTLPRDTPERPLLVFVAFLVAVGSLMIQGFTLPGVAKRVGLVGAGETGLSDEEEDALDDELQEAAASALASAQLTRRDGSEFPPALIERVAERLTRSENDETSTLAADMSELRLAMLGAMRARLNDLSSDGIYSTAALRHALAELDADEISLRLRLGGDD
ncbi:cation:proton antiporter [Microbacterium sp. P01]|uniref:cation:proton antiporter n=1 Tax=unclassified Microbacterium TaxID=2609290 RepID=UPI00366C4DF4